MARSGQESGVREIRLRRSRRRGLETDPCGHRASPRPYEYRVLLRRGASARRGVQLDSLADVPPRCPMRLIGLAVSLAVSLTLAPLAAEAQQQAAKVYRVGWIVSSPTATPHLQAAFRLGLSERGYVEGKNL